MSASSQGAGELRRSASVLPERLKAAARELLVPVVRLAIALRLTPNSITVIGLGITVVASVLVAGGQLLLGAVLLAAGSLLDAVDGALARATGGETPFGGFLDSTLDRAGEAIIYVGIGVWLVLTVADPVLPLVALMAAMAGSFLVSYAHARAQGIGLAADVGLAPRTERLILVIVGVALAGFGSTIGLIGILVFLAVLTVVTVIQRIVHVWRVSQATARDIKES
jgi:CDP-diacylglycerol---glycerol-3-phosphate 3-phosphatidyltransferase